MSSNEIKELFLNDIKYVKEGELDIVKGKVYSVYPKKAFFTDKYNYYTFHLIYVKDIFNNILAQEKFPSAHENLNLLNEMTYFIPTVWYITFYYFISYNYQLRVKMKSNFKGRLYSLAIPIIGSFVVSIMKNGSNFFYDKYLREDLFISDEELKEAKILSFKMNSIQYSDFLYRHHLQSRKVIYTDQQILSTDMTKKE
jgi:hypothetical protein